MGCGEACAEVSAPWAELAEGAGVVEGRAEVSAERREGRGWGRAASSEWGVAGSGRRRAGWAWRGEVRGRVDVGPGLGRVGRAGVRPWASGEPGRGPGAGSARGTGGFRARVSGEAPGRVGTPGAGGGARAGRIGRGVGAWGRSWPVRNGRSGRDARGARCRRAHPRPPREGKDGGERRRAAGAGRRGGGRGRGGRAGSEARGVGAVGDPSQRGRGEVDAFRGGRPGCPGPWSLRSAAGAEE